MTRYYDENGSGYISNLLLFLNFRSNQPDGNIYGGIEIFEKQYTILKRIKIYDKVALRFGVIL